MMGNRVGFGHVFPKCPAGEYLHFSRRPLTVVSMELPITYRQPRRVEIRMIDQFGKGSTETVMRSADLGADGVERLKELRIAEITSQGIRSEHVEKALALFARNYRLLMDAREENGALYKFSCGLVGQDPDFKDPDVVQKTTNLFSTRLDGENAMLITLVRRKPMQQIDLNSMAVLDLFEKLRVDQPMFNDRTYRSVIFQTFRVFGDGAAFVDSFWLPFELVAPNECEKSG
ncbi:MAG: hypothetical protein WC527_03875 [Candidatus Margulisiibacteriota bacterium]